MRKQKAYITTKNTKLKSIRVPHWLVELVEKECNQNAAFVELLEIGAKQKYGSVSK